MNTIIDDIKHKFKNAEIVEKLIYVNIVLFLITVFANKDDSNIIIEWFSLNPNIDIFLSKPWTIITYGFIHAGFIHLFSNLIVLFFIGNLFLEYFNTKQLFSFYIFGTLFGGILFLTGYNYIPIFKNNTTPLVGASAGVLAIFIGIATYLPNYQLKIRFLGYIHLWKIALVFIILDIIQLSGMNAGGHFAHLGGALFGFLYVNAVKENKKSIFQSFIDLFKKKEKQHLKTVYNSGKKKNINNRSYSTDNQEQVDIILDKISKSGYDTLTKEEKAFLFKQGKN